MINTRRTNNTLRDLFVLGEPSQLIGKRGEKKRGREERKRKKVDKEKKEKGKKKTKKRERREK